MKAAKLVIEIMLFLKLGYALLKNFYFVDLITSF